MEVYSKLYYTSRITAAMTKRMKVLGTDPPPVRVQVIREVTRELWEGEDKDIKAVVAVKMASNSEVAVDDEEGDDEGTRTLQQYQRWAAHTLTLCTTNPQLARLRSSQRT